MRMGWHKERFVIKARLIYHLNCLLQTKQDICRQALKWGSSQIFTLCSHGKNFFWLKLSWDDLWHMFRCPKKYFWFFSKNSVFLGKLKFSHFLDQPIFRGFKKMPYFKTTTVTFHIVEWISSAIPFWKAKSPHIAMVASKIPEPGTFGPGIRDKVGGFPEKNGRFRPLISQVCGGFRGPAPGIS